MPMFAKKILLLSLFTLTWVGDGFAQTAGVTMTTYYPSPFGEYNTLRLLPRAGDLANPCTVGSLYVNSSGVLQYCYRQGATGVWGAPSEVWNQSGDDIFLTDTLTDPDLRVGIGTTTPGFKLTIVNDGGIIAKGDPETAGLPSLGAGARLIWYPGGVAFRAGHVNGTQWDDDAAGAIGSYSVAMGLDTVSSGFASVVGGGALNTANGEHSTVAGGKQNTASGASSAIAGGEGNTASGNYSTVSGGSNSATADYTTIVGGYTNQATAAAATAGGGVQNIASSSYSIVGGGYQNLIPFPAAGMTGYAVIGGGDRNIARSDYTVVSGGSQNTSSAAGASISGGWNNLASATGASISGGWNNIASGLKATVAGGRENYARGNYSTIGGKANEAIGDYSVIPGGGWNITSGYASSLLGGLSNIAAGDHSLVGGMNMQLDASADDTFLWGHAASAIPPISTPDAFIIYSGKVGIHDETPAAILGISNSGALTDDYLAITSDSANPAGDILMIKNTGLIGVGRANPLHPLHFGNGAYLSIDGIWVDGSSRDYKENIAPLDPDRAVAALKELSPVQYNYKNSPAERHVGFVAEEVPDLVADRSRQELTPMDFVAVLTSVIQNQQKDIEEQEQKLNYLKQEVQRLKEQFND